MELELPSSHTSGALFHMPSKFSEAIQIYKFGRFRRPRELAIDGVRRGNAKRAAAAVRGSRCTRAAERYAWVSGARQVAKARSARRGGVALHQLRAGDARRLYACVCMEEEIISKYHCAI